jgi:ABC-type transporter MlaC component
LTKCSPKHVLLGALCAVGFTFGLNHEVQAGPGWTAVDHLLASFDSNRVTKLPPAKGAVSANGAAGLIDYSEMAARCLGRKDWDGLTADQRKQFVEALKGSVERRYYPRWRKLFSKGKVTFQDEITQGGDIVVRTKFLLGKKEEMIAWRVVDHNGALRVVSLSVSDKDLLERLKVRIKARHEKVGFAGLLAWMRGKGDDELSNGTAGGAIAPIAASKSPTLSLPALGLHGASSHGSTTLAD